MILNKEKIKELSREQAIDLLDTMAQLTLVGVLQAGKNCCDIKKDLDEIEKTEKIQDFVNKHRPKVKFLTTFEKCQAIMANNTLVLESSGIRPYLNIDQHVEEILDSELEMVDRMNKDR